MVANASPPQKEHSSIRSSEPSTRPAATPSRLSGRKFIITAGPTHEPIDADHFIGTHDTGQLGYKLAEAAVTLGSETVLVSGPAHLPLPQGAQLMPVTTAIEMLSLCERELPCDIAICAAAASKWRLNPAENASNSLQVAPAVQLSLIETPDIAKVLATRRDRRPTVVVGCATERDNAVENGRAKFRETKCDLVLIEDASPAAEDLISDRVTVHLISRRQSRDVVTPGQRRDRPKADGSTGREARRQPMICHGGL